MLIKNSKILTLSIMEVKTSDVIITFNPQYLPKHAALILQGGGSQRGGSQRGGSRWLRTPQFSLLQCNLSFKSPMIILARKLFFWRLTIPIFWRLVTLEQSFRCLASILLSRLAIYLVKKDSFLS